MNNINRLITLWMRECWHKENVVEVYGNPVTQCSCGRRGGETCLNPDFSQPDHFARFTGRLFENKEMWDKYYQYAFKRYLNSETHNTFVPWLFSDRTLFVTLFAEFLRLDETVEEFGREECPALTAYCGEFPCKQNDCKDGKVLSAWAREVKEREDG